MCSRAGPRSESLSLDVEVVAECGSARGGYASRTDSMVAAWLSRSGHRHLFIRQLIS